MSSPDPASLGNSSTVVPRRGRALGAHNGPVVARSRIVELVHGAVRAPEDADVDGASSQELEDLERRLGPLPAQLAAWLRICRGAAIGPGGFFGNRPDRPSLDIPAYLALFPEWADKGWLPVAGDGCGNYYVLLPSGQVGFVDTISGSTAVEPDPHPDLYSCVEALLRGDQMGDP